MINVTIWFGESFRAPHATTLDLIRGCGVCVCVWEGGDGRVI